jgi:alkylhydroperoxidase/carboxymuconolactone decarboxylase family protein YurZ
VEPLRRCLPLAAPSHRGSVTTAAVQNKTQPLVAVSVAVAVSVVEAVSVSVSVAVA